MPTIVTNARIFTSNDAAPWASVLAIDGDCISYVGDDRARAASSLGDRRATVVDLKGKTVLPGFVDSHVHPAGVSRSLWHVALPWPAGVDTLLTFVRRYAEAHPVDEQPFLYFEYYDAALFGEKGPTKELLDTAVAGRPCLLQESGDHMSWVNSRMLECLEVDRDTPDPMAGLRVFTRDADGEPTGLLKEGAWIAFQENLFTRIDWRPPTALTPELLAPFFAFMTHHGVTAIADGITAGEEEVRAIAQMEERGELAACYDGAIMFQGLSDLPERIAEAGALQDAYGSRHIKLNTLKLFFDGTNEAGNACLIEPYTNDPSGKEHGSVAVAEDDFVECLRLCNEAGVDIALHLVGDGAFRWACDAFEKAKGRAPDRWRTQMILLHCELVDPADMHRPRELGVTVNWTPHWSGGYFGEEARRFLGEERWNRMYQFNPIIDSGALVAFSSDVVSYTELHRADPLFGIQVGHTRVDPEPGYRLDPVRFPGSVRPPESARLSRETLVRGYTISGARQLRWDDRMGSLEVGKLANLCVLSENLFEVEAERIKDVEVETVLFEGRVLKGQL